MYCTVQLYTPTELVYVDGTSGIQAVAVKMLIITFICLSLTTSDQPCPVLPICEPMIILHTLSPATTTQLTLTTTFPNSLAATGQPVGAV